MSKFKTPSRRGILTGGLGLVGGALAVTGLPSTAYAGDRPQPSEATSTWSKDTSANGWPVTDHDGIAPHKVEGSPITVSLRGGDSATVLLYVARRFFYELDSELRTEDISGHTTDRAVAAAYESNLLSGTALTIRPGAYPLGAKDGFFPQEIQVIRDILADCEGIVRWGGDEKLPKESHFQIDVKPGDKKLPRVAAKIRSWDTTPGAGAGAIDPFTPQRRRDADALARTQAA
ncbi:hypothetical protein [Streptomyces violascens]|uniref:Secreted protein n=1 Tax=Streptomyces violascens TaxID=67381 RepID=A0ABQ3QWQ0_9ACTN|nr:hypothetical protein [Streptomyces violascens]GGU11800.1 hypothetical protein GCM10010289_36400 [Streptomyces violascens]GHI41691.1 hypothetical protein Sviol_60990 [Streptomyces violascens]